MPDGVQNGQFGIGLVIDFFGLAAKASGFPVEFVYPSMTAIVPANIAAVAGSKSPEGAKRFMQFTLSDEGQQLLLDPKISRLPVLPATYAKAPAGYPNPFSGTIQAKVNFDTDLSESRYYVVSSLFDQVITFRHKELQAATKAIHDAEKRLGGRASAQLDEAKKLAWTSPLSAEQAKDKELLAVFKAKKGDDAALRRKTQIEEEWSSKAKANYARAVELATRREMILVAVALAIAAFLAVFLAAAGRERLLHRVRQQRRRLHAGHFESFFQISLMRESFWNSLYVAGLSVVFASLIAVPLAYFTVRFRFRGALLIQTLGVLPLIMPPFVGAVAMQLLFGRSGSVNLLLNDAFGFTVPFMEGLNGVIFVESLHYFPFILLNLVVALRNIDGAMEESAQNLGASGWRLFRRIVFPLALPGYVAGASLVFVKVFDDLGTPLVLGTTNMLAPQAYLRITSVGIEDPIGYVISVDHGRLLGRRAVGLGADPQGPRLRDAAARRHVAAASATSRRWQAARRLRLDRRWCCCWCSRRTSASC